MMEKCEMFWKERENLDFIASLLGKSDAIDHIIFDLVDRGVIAENVAGVLLNNENTNMNKARSIVYLLANIKVNMNKEIAEIFYKNGLKETSELIDSQYTAMITSSDSNWEYGRELHTLPNIHASASLPTFPTVPSSPRLPESSSMDEKLDKSTNGEFRIMVTPSQYIYGSEDSLTVYKNESNPRGFVFLVNIAKFDNNEHRERIGSEIDVENIKELFTQMGYLVEEHSNLTKTQLLKALTKFSEDDKLQDVDSCVVVIMSHGSDDRRIITSDNRTITDMEIIEYFNSKNCKNLFQKPKIFIFQYCRGDMFDFGVEPVQKVKMVSNDNINISSTTFIDGKAFGETMKITRSSSYSDIFCVYATIEGFVAYLNVNRGSWLVESICVEFMEHAHNSDLLSLMMKVSKRIKDFHSTDGRKQTIEQRIFGFDKHFYFNPQRLYSLDSSSLNSLHELSSALPQEGVISNTNLSITPPHERRHRELESQSRCSTPDYTMYDVRHSGSGSRLRSRHSSGASVESRDPNLLSPAVRPKNNRELSPRRRFSFGMAGIDDERREPLNQGSENAAAAAIDVVDNPRTLSGTAEDFKTFRLRSCPDITNEKPSGFKRQLSAPTDTDALNKIHKLEQYLQIHELDDLAEHLVPIKDEIQKKKSEGKRRRPNETNSLEF